MVVNVLLNIADERFGKLQGARVENDQCDLHFVCQQEFADLRHGNFQRFVFREAVGAGGDQRECDGFASKFICKRK